MLSRHEAHEGTEEFGYGTLNVVFFAPFVVKLL